MGLDQWNGGVTEEGEICLQLHEWVTQIGGMRECRGGGGRCIHQLRQCDILIHLLLLLLLFHLCDIRRPHLLPHDAMIERPRRELLS